MNLHSAINSDLDAILQAFLWQGRASRSRGETSIWDRSEISHRPGGGYQYRFDTYSHWTRMNPGDQDYWIRVGKVLLAGGVPNE